jgi:hypothetical protein
MTGFGSGKWDNSKVAMNRYASALKLACFALLGGAVLSNAEDRAPGQTGTNLPAAAALVPRGSDLVTTDGTVYRQAQVERVEPDGIAVTFAPPGGGIGMAKLKFRNMPEDVQRQYGYNARQSAEYEAEQERSLKEFRARMWADFDAECAARAQARRDSEQEIAEQEQQQIREEQERQREQEDAADEPPPMPIWWDSAIVNAQPTGFVHHHRSAAHHRPAASGTRRVSTRRTEELPPPIFSQFPPPGFRQLPLPTPHQANNVTSRLRVPASVEGGHFKKAR